jgi:hypothetical protein
MCSPVSIFQREPLRTLAATSQPVVTALAVGGSGVYWAEGASLMHASLPP